MALATAVEVVVAVAMEVVATEAAVVVVIVAAMAGVKMLLVTETLTVLCAGKGERLL